MTQAQEHSDRWYEYTGLDGRADYRAVNGLTVERVIFDRYNTTAKVRERVSVHWTEAGKWADADPCGGLGLCGVMMSDGREAFASGRYAQAHHRSNERRFGLCSVWVCSSEWLRMPVTERPTARICDCFECNPRKSGQ